MSVFVFKVSEIVWSVCSPIRILLLHATPQLPKCFDELVLCTISLYAAELISDFLCLWFYSSMRKRKNEFDKIYCTEITPPPIHWMFYHLSHSNGRLDLQKDESKSDHFQYKSETIGWSRVSGYFQNLHQACLWWGGAEQSWILEQLRLFPGVQQVRWSSHGLGWPHWRWEGSQQRIRLGWRMSL